MPPGTRSVNEKNIYDQSFGKFQRIEGIIATPKNNFTNMLSPDALLELYSLHEKIEAIAVQSKSGRTIITWQDICFRPAKNKPCLFNTVFDYWWNKTLQNFDIDAIRASSLEDIRSAVSDISAKTPYDNPILPQQIMGDRQYFFLKIMSVSAFFNVYLINNQPEMVEDAIEWESKFIEICDAFNKTSQYIGISYSSEVNFIFFYCYYFFFIFLFFLSLLFKKKDSLNKELSSKVASDFYLTVISYGVMIVFVGLVLGRFHWIQSRLLLGLGGIFTVIVSIFGSLGKILFLFFLFIYNYIFFF